MADISKITVPDGTTYDLKDAEAREQIDALSRITWNLGVTTTELTDGADTNPITINGESVTAVNGNIATYGSAEFLFNGSVWQEFGDLSNLGDLAYKNSASSQYQPVGTVSQPTTTVQTTETTVNSITDVGTLPTYTVSSETLVITAGTLPTKGTDTTVIASVDGAITTQPTFTGTETTITVS